MPEVSASKLAAVEIPEYVSQHDALASHKGDKRCPVCTATVQKTSKGSRRLRQCDECGAVWAKDLKCKHCSQHKIWRGKRGLYCQSCGREHRL